MEKFGLLMKHIKVLYYALILVIVVDTGYQLYTMRFVEMKQSFDRGRQSAQEDWGQIPSLYTKELFNLRHNPHLNKQKTETIVSNDSININVEVLTFDASVHAQHPIYSSVGNKILQIVFMFLTLFSSLWTLVLGIRLLINVGKSIFRKDIFNLKTITLCKRYALVLAILSVSLGLSSIMNEQAVAQYFVNTDWDFIFSFPIDLNGISTAILVYLFSEILKIGYLLKQEQELTI
ncbi:MAG: DUF2975 domain-containing protein [Bacteroidales bacterium]